MKRRDIYVCSECGNSTLVWQGQCPSCREWNTLAAHSVEKSRVPGRAPATALAVPISNLEDVADDTGRSRSTGMAELDRLLGRGLTPGAVVLLSGEPGIGKSTLLLQLAGRMAEDGRRAVYVSGEESLAQLKARAERLGLLGRGLPAVATTRLTDVRPLFDDGDAFDLLIVDSVQTLAAGDDGGLPGSVGQVRAVATELTELVKRSGATLVLVSHVTKEGHIAGPKLLEHMVDTVLYLEGDRRHAYRILRVLKNRFGPSDELLVLEMGGAGLAVVPDPSTYFLGNRDASLPGTAVVMAMDGGRPFAVEVQALVAHSMLSIPRRTALGFDTGRLNLLLAVMEKRMGLNFGQMDVYAKTGGGLRLAEPGLDLGIVAAVLSSLQDRALPEGAVFWGEVDLGGMVRPVAGHEVRLKQARRLGYGPLFYSRQGRKGSSTLSGFAQALWEKGG